MECYLDTSAWIAWKFGQRGKEIFDKVSLENDVVMSSPLLVAEYTSFLKRIRGLADRSIEKDLTFVQWLYPSKPLYDECLQCVSESSLRGADVHHLATALWVSEGAPQELTFLSCDGQQLEVARQFGFNFVP